MASHIATGSVVTSWAGTANTALISSGSAPYRWNLNVTNPETDVTPMASGGATARAYALGLGQWDGSISTRLNPVKYGSGGLVSGSSSYVTNTRNWRLSIAATPVEKSTAMNGTPPTWQTWLPNLISWSGTYEAMLDTSTSLTLPSITADTLTFKMVENASNDHTLSGSALVSQLGAPIQVGQLAVATYSFRGTGAITAAGTSGSGVGNPIFAAGAVAGPASGELVLTSSSGKTYTGDAFWTSVDINCVVDEVIDITINFQGTGALAIA